MKIVTNVIGILLILFGVVCFTYQGINYTSREQVAQIGGLQVTAETEKRISVPPLAAGAALIAGIILVVIANTRKK